MAIEKVVYEAKHDVQTNDARTITTLFDGDISDFSCEQIRIAHIIKGGWMGNHWREYPELYGVIGTATFVLEDINAKQRKKYTLDTGDRLFVPPRVALKVRGKVGTVIIVCASKADRSTGTHAYQVD